MRLRKAPMYLYVVAVFLFIILLKSILGISLDYFQYRRDLPRLLTGSRSELIAGYLSAIYTQNQGWNELENELDHMISLNYLGEQNSANIRLVIHDAEGKMLLNSFESLSTVGNTPLIQGENSEIHDLGTSAIVGSVTLYIGADYMENESKKYLISLLSSLFRREVVTSIIAVFLLFILSKRLTHPLSELQVAISAVSSDRKRQIQPSGSAETVSLGETFNEMTRELERQKVLRHQMVADLAHDLNSPLHAIRLEARALKDGLSSAEEASREIINRIDSLSNLVYDLDYLSDVDSGEMVMNIQSIHLQTFLSNVAQEWKLAAEAECMSVVCVASSEDLGYVSMDEVRLQRAVSNLIQNALRYNKAGNQVVLSGQTSNNLVSIQVCDDGTPIPSDIREKIFERFYRFDSSRSRSTSGSGLGLSIVRQIAELHGGTAKLVSGNESGNCFIIEFPLSNPPQPSLKTSV